METIKKRQLQQAAIIEELSATPYACSAIEPLGGGLMNATYRGHLLRPLSEGAATVIIKHGEDCSHELQLKNFSTIRCLTEQTMLLQMESWSSPLNPIQQISVKYPRLYHYFPKSNIQITEDFGNSESLHLFMHSPAAANMTSSTATELGENLGIWISHFHARFQSCINQEMSELIERNSDAIAQSVGQAMYQAFDTPYLSNQAKNYAIEELGKADVSNHVVLHGDFSIRNVLIQDSLTFLKRHKPSIAIIDWEMCRYGDRVQDICPMVTCLYASYHFSELENALSMLKGFLKMFKPLDEELAYRIVVHTGIYIFFSRFLFRDGDERKLGELLRLGSSLIVMGSERDRTRIAGTFFGCMFANL